MSSTRYTIRPLGCAAYSEVGSVRAARRDYRAAVALGLRGVRVIDAQGNDITDAVLA